MNFSNGRQKAIEIMKQQRSIIFTWLSTTARLAVPVFLVLGLAGCALFRGEKDESDVEKLRLKYQKGKMGALLKIIEIYEDPEQPHSSRLAAARAMGESRHPKAVDALAQNIRNAENLDIEIMLSSIDILAGIPSHESARAFTEAFTSVDLKLNELRNKLVEGLEAVGSEDYIQSLIDLYQNSRENQIRMEQMLTGALANIGDDKAIPVLIDIAGDPAVSMGTRSAAIEILSKKESPEVVQLFAEMLGEPTSNLQLRQFALRAMGDIKEERLVLALLETYQLGRQEYFALMNTLLTALGDFDDPTIKPTLVEIAMAPDLPGTFRKRAITSLANFEDPMVLNRIIPLLEHTENYFLYGEIITLTAALQPGPEGQERLRRAALKASNAWERKQ